VPSATTVAEAIALASHAPSFANAHPWRWHLTREALELYVVPDRLRGEGADRSMLISCGATLHHLEVAMAASGWRAKVQRLPDGDERLLAALTFSPGTPDAHERAVASSIPHRSSYRSPMASWPVPDAHLGTLTAIALEHGALLVPLTDPADRDAWTSLASSVGERHRGAGRALPSRPADPDDRNDLDDASVALVLATSSDDRLARLRAGEALSAVLLEADRIGMVSRIRSSVVDVERTRDLLEQGVLQGTRSPQLVICVGWPGSAPADADARIA